MKKNMRLSLVIGTFLTWLNLGTALAQGQFGSYTGVLKNEKLGQEQLAKLDFIMSRQSGNELELRAVLILYFGDFSSSEYVSYHFDDVKFNLVTGLLVIDQPDQDITLVVKRFSTGALEGSLRSAVGGDVGQLLLQDSAVVETNVPLIQPLGGEYRGICQDTATFLQIQANRSTEDTSRVGNPFGTFDLKAQLATVDGSSCSGDGTPCVRQVYDSGTYNFYTGEVSLFGISRDLSCKATPEGLDCNGCQLRRKAVSVTPPQTYSLSPSRPFWEMNENSNEPATVEPPGSLQGEYRGYLHNERLDVYMPASFNLVVNPDNQTNQLMMSAVASIYFGSHGSSEAIPYRFNERAFDLFSTQFVFERLSGDTDAVLQVTKIANGEVEGVWYSILYGRVGTFRLNKDSLIALPSTAKMFGRVAGRYQNATWLLNLATPQESAPINTRNPFFPLNFKGHARLLPNVTANLPIKGGSFDFYTGKLMLVLEDGSTFSGMRTSSGDLQLHRPSQGSMRPLPSANPQVFKPIAPSLL